MKRNLKIFLLFSKYALKTTFQHPIGSLFFLLGKSVRFGMYFIFIIYLLNSTKLLAGYNITQTIIFFLTFNIVDTTAQLLFREVYRFRPLVVSGELDAVLIKPYHPFMRILVGGIDLLDLFTVFIYIILLVIFILQLPMLTFAHVVTFLILIGNALIIATGFHIIVLSLGILTTEVDHAVMIYRDITRIGAFPIDIYKEPLRSLFTFVLPVGIMASFPVKSLLGLLSVQFIVSSFVISLLFLWFSMFLWDRALKKYQSWGG